MSEVPLLLFTKVPPEEAKQSCMHLWVGPYLEHTGPKNTCLTLFYSKDISVINTWNTFFEILICQCIYEDSSRTDNPMCRYWSLIYQCRCPFFHTSHWFPVINIAHCLPCFWLVLKKTNKQALTLLYTINIQDNHSYTCSLHSISTGPALIFDCQTLVVVVAA